MTETESTRFPLSYSNREGWVLPILLGLAFAVRLYLVFHTHIIINDGVLYVKMAKFISQGEGREALSLWTLNLYPLIIAAFQKVFCDWEFSGQMASALFGSFTIIPFYLLIRSLFSRSVALFSSIIFVFHPYVARFSAEVIRGPTFWFFFMMSLWAGWEAVNRKKPWLFAMTGVLGALSFLLRTEGIFVVPLVAVWLFLSDFKTLKATYRQRILFALILFFTVPILLSPGVLYLKKETGHWHWARADQILGLAFSDVTMNKIEKNFDKIEVKPWGNDAQAKLELIRLRQFLSLAKDHRRYIIGIEMIRNFLKTMHPLLFGLLVFGAVRRKDIQCHKKEELFLLSALAILVLALIRYGTAYFYVGKRHMTPLVILCLAWVGVGVLELEHRIRYKLLREGSNGLKIVHPRNLRWALLILILFVLLPKTLDSQRVEKIPIKEAGLWIREYGHRNPVVMGQGQLGRIAFYADGIFLEVPRDKDLFEYAKKNQVNFLAVNEKDIEKTHPGLSRSLNPEHFKEEVAFGEPSGPYLIRIYSLKN